jgi:hypothetical protein
MLEHLLPCCFIHESEWLFRNIDETSSTGTARSDAYVSWPERKCSRFLEGSTSCSVQNPRRMVRALTNFRWRLMRSHGGHRESCRPSYAYDIHVSDSRLPTGNIATLSGQLPLLSNLFGLCARSLRALRGAQGRSAHSQPDPSLSSLPAGRLRSGPLNG